MTAIVHAIICQNALCQDTKLVAPPTVEIMSTIIERKGYRVAMRSTYDLSLCHYHVRKSCCALESYFATSFRVAHGSAEQGFPRAWRAEAI